MTSTTERTKAWRLANPEKYKELNRQQYLKNKDKIKARAKAWDAENKERVKIRKARKYKDGAEQIKVKSKARYKTNKEAIKAAAVEWQKANPDAVARRTKKWKASNQDRVRLYAANRRAAQLQATPQWVDMEAIAAVYAEAVRLGLSVDHVIPLQGKNVCGLHVAGNLQLMTGAANSAKGNKFNCGT